MSENPCKTCRDRGIAPRPEPVVVRMAGDDPSENMAAPCPGGYPVVPPTTWRRALRRMTLCVIGWHGPLVVDDARVECDWLGIYCETCGVNRKTTELLP